MNRRGATCHGHYRTCTHASALNACSDCVRQRRAEGLLLCADVDNCEAPGRLGAPPVSPAPVLRPGVAPADERGQT